ncbi:hypothetical protein [Gracilibacillus thailandensis]|uniref:Uncharacterized protein n=1 Tax=Gracilibacillus thailandensis TaxID=563735 RepID=A0A6N7R1F4_9BACI|nr:hypothetical protein [Gracilibacillus thailandensis]MRI66199.1 hypothetical protein [Gracilibacillus thailandensis]
MKKYLFIALFPAMTPTIILGFIFALIGFSQTMSTSVAVITSIFIGIISSLINPMTYIVALLFGFTSYKVKNIWKRLVIQVFVFSLGYTLIIMIQYSIEGAIQNQFINIIYVFLGTTAINIILSLMNLGIEKLYLKKVNAVANT